MLNARITRLIWRRLLTICMCTMLLFTTGLLHAFGKPPQIKDGGTKIDKRTGLPFGLNKGTRTLVHVPHKHPHNKKFTDGYFMGMWKIPFDKSIISTVPTEMHVSDGWLYVVGDSPRVSTDSVICQSEGCSLVVQAKLTLPDNKVVDRIILRESSGFPVYIFDKTDDSYIIDVPPGHYI